MSSKKEGSFKVLFFVMIVSLFVASFWEKLPFLKSGVHSFLDPSIGTVLNWNLTLGMLFVTMLISFLTTIVQKYATDQKTLKELRKEQKILQQEIKKYKHDPEKVLELQKKQFEFIPKTTKLSMRAILFTGIPFILLFRWFWDFFNSLGNPKFFGIFSWFWFYLIFTMIFTSIFRKVLDVV